MCRASHRSRREVLKGRANYRLGFSRSHRLQEFWLRRSGGASGWTCVALSQRKDTAKILLNLESGPVSGRVQKPEIIISTAKVLGKVNVQIVGPRTLGGELVDYLWLRDAATKDLLGCKDWSTNGGAPGSKGDPTLSSLVKRDTRVIPYMHCSVSGLWGRRPCRGETDLNRGTSCSRLFMKRSFTYIMCRIPLPRSLAAPRATPAPLLASLAWAENNHTATGQSIDATPIAALEAMPSKITGLSI